MVVPRAVPVALMKVLSPCQRLSYVGVAGAAWQHYVASQRFWWRFICAAFFLARKSPDAPQRVANELSAWRCSSNVVSATWKGYVHLAELPGGRTS